MRFFIVCLLNLFCGTLLQGFLGSSQARMDLLDALRQAIVQLPRDADPQVVAKMTELKQRLATMQVQPQRGQITRGQTIGIVIACAVAVLGALLLRGLH